MWRRFSRRICSAIALMIGVAAPFCLSSAAYGQVVSDRALSDVKVDHVGSCTTLTVNFNIRVQLVSYFPTEGGRELHIRIRPLDVGGAGLLRESLRTPTTVPTLRSIEYEGDNPSGPVLSLFFTQEMRFDVQAGTQPQSLVIRLDGPGTGDLCNGAGAAPRMPVGVFPQRGEPAPAIAIPSGLYAVNLLSQPDAIGVLTDPQRAALAGRIVYEMTFEHAADHWHRLRIGFFDSRGEAEAAARKLKAMFPDTWVIKVSTDETGPGGRQPHRPRRSGRSRGIAASRRHTRAGGAGGKPDRRGGTGDHRWQQRAGGPAAHQRADAAREPELAARARTARPDARADEAGRARPGRIRGLCAALSLWRGSRPRAPAPGISQGVAGGSVARAFRPPRGHPRNGHGARAGASRSFISATRAPPNSSMPRVPTRTRSRTTR